MNYKYILNLLSFFVINVIMVSNSFAQYVSTGGPAGGANIRTIISWSDTAYAGINAYLMRTFDGTNWEKVTNGLAPETINPYCFARLGNILYMGTNNGERAYKSTDFGNSWTIYNAGLPFLYGYPSAVPMMAVTSGERVFMGGTNFGLVYTEASSTVWISTSLSSGNVTAISVIGQDSVWATVGNKTYYSHDNGDTWTQTTTEPITTNTIGATAFVKAGNRIIAATNAGGNNSGLYSEDYGNSWTHGVPGFALGKNFIKINDNNIYGLAHDGVYKSTDKGSSWNLVSSISGASYMSLWKGDELLVGSAYGLYELPNLGSDPAERVPFNMATVKGMLVLNNKLFALSTGGLYSKSLSSDGWALVNDLNTLFTSGVNSLKYYEGKLFVTTDLGIYYSTDEGESFSSITSVEYNNIIDMVNVGNHISAYNAKTSKIIYSPNFGDSWSIATLTGFPSFPAFVSSQIILNGSRLIMSGNSGYAISTDNGASWVYTATATGYFAPAAKVYALGTALFRELNNGVQTFAIEKSTDNGATWVVYENGLPERSNSELSDARGLFLSGSKLYTYLAKSGEEGIYSLSEENGIWGKEVSGKLNVLPNQILSAGGKVYVALPENSVWMAVGILSDRDPLVSSGNLSIYPNPADKIINYSIPSKGLHTYELTNLQGKVLISGFSNGKTGELNVSALPKGVYFMVIYSEGKKEVQRVLVK